MDNEICLIVVFLYSCTKKSIFPSQGLILAHTVKYSIETVLNLHTALGRPMGRAAALSVCRLVESLKAIEETYRRHSTLLARSLPHVMQYLTCQILIIVAGAKVCFS